MQFCSLVCGWAGWFSSWLRSRIHLWSAVGQVAVSSILYDAFSHAWGLASWRLGTLGFALCVCHSPAGYLKLVYVLVVRFEESSWKLFRLKFKMDQSHFHLILLVDARRKANPDWRVLKETLLLDKELWKHGTKGADAGKAELLGLLPQPQHPKEPGHVKK